MKLIELLLTENVENLGIIGDVVKVRPGFARNFLLPHGMAMAPSAGAIARLAERRKEVEAEMKVLRKEREELFERIDELELTIERSANDQGVLFGGVSQHDIAEALRAAGHNIEDRAVRIGEQIKRLDTYYVPLALASDLKTLIKLVVISDKPEEEQAQEDQAQDDQADSEEVEADEND